MAKIKCPRKLDISVFYQLTRRLPHEDLNYDDERSLIHFYDTFYNGSMKLSGHTVRCRVNVLYHLLVKIGKEPNADLFNSRRTPVISELRKKSSSHLKIYVGIILQYLLKNLFSVSPLTHNLYPNVCIFGASI